MYKVSKPKGSLANITITNEETTSSVVLGRFNIKHKSILDAAEIIAPPSIDEWDFEVKDEVGKALAMSCFTGHRPARTRIKNDEQKKDAESTQVKTKKFSAYDYLFGYTDELEG